MTTTPTPRSRRFPLPDLLIGGCLLAFAIAMNRRSPDHSDNEWSQRLLFLAIGLVSAYYANAAAKKLTPLAEIQGDPAAEQSLRRFSAWSLTLGAVGYAIAWLVVPFNHAPVVAVALLAAALLLVAARHIRANIGRARS